MEELEAVEQSRLFTAPLLPYMRDSARRSILENVRRKIKRGQARFASRPQYDFIEYDPEKASEFFEQQGMKVVTAKSHRHDEREDAQEDDG